MRLSPRRWRPRHLVLSWCAYWIALVLAKLGPALVAGWRVSQVPAGHGSMNASMGDGNISATIVEAGRTTWSGSMSILNLTLLIAVPPLVLWLVWLLGPSRTNNADQTELDARAKWGTLHARGSRPETIDVSTSKRDAREHS